MRILAVLLLALVPGMGATVVMDWLSLSGSALVDDDGESMASIALEVNTGTALPGSPSADMLGGSFWGEMIPFADSLGDSATVSTFSAQVAPVGGQADWNITVTPSHPVLELVVGVGQLISDGVQQTQGVTVTATTSSGLAMVTFEGAYAWSDGLQSLEREVAWNGAANELTLVSNAAGESKMAFLSITSTEAIEGVHFGIPQSYGEGLGDAIEFAVGMPIPEPGTAGLVVLATWMFGVGFRRK